MNYRKYTEEEALHILRKSEQHIAGMDIIPLKEMFVDHGYGRALVEARVRKITRNFVEAGLGVVYLSLRSSGMYALLDGQHRWEAAKRKDVGQLHARIYIDLAYEEEAVLYTIFGEHKAQSRADIFKANIEAQDPAALSVARIVERVGLSFYGNKGASGNIQAIGTVENIQHLYGAEMLDLVIRTLYAAFETNSRAYQKIILEGVAQFAMRYEATADWTRLVRRMSEVGITALIQAAIADKTTVWAGDRGVVMGKVLHSLYNHRLSEEHQLTPWETLRGAPLQRAPIIPENLRLKQRLALKDVPRIQAIH